MQADDNEALAGVLIYNKEGMKKERKHYKSKGSCRRILENMVKKKNRTKKETRGARYNKWGLFGVLF